MSLLDTTVTPLTSADTNGIAPRTYLAVTVGVCSVSVLGTIGIILPFIFSPTWRRLRHRLIVGLAVSDFIVALTILIISGEALNTNGSRNVIEGDAACNTAGWFYLIGIYGATLSTLCIAVCTYALLMYPLSRMVEIISRPLTPLYLIFSFWVFGAVITAIGYGIWGFQRSTLTVCFFGNNSGQFATLVLLLPRCIVFLVVILLYLKLFWHFRSAGKTIVVSDYDESMPSRMPENAFSPMEHDSRRGSAATGTDTTGDSGKIFGAWTFSSRAEERQDSSTVLLTPDSPKTSTRPSFSRLLTSKTRLARVDSDRVIGMETGVQWGEKTAPPEDEKSSALEVIAPDVLAAERPPLDRVNSRSLGGDVIHAAPRHSPPLSSEKPSRPEENMSKLSAATSRSIAMPASGFSPSNLALALSRSISRPQRTVTPPTRDPTIRRAPPVPSGEQIVAAGDAARRRASQKGPDSGEDGLLGMAAALHDDGEGSTMGARERRMSAQEMNRKASVMMTLYPLAYIVLFSVSIARIANEIANGESGNSVLSVLSKWLIYFSGAVDFLVFIIIESGVRRLMRKV